MSRSLHFVVPNEIETRSGGYGYDREIIEGLRGRGWTVQLTQLTGAYPTPTPDDRAEAGQRLAAIAAGACTVVDGLAFGALPREVERERDRLHLIALVHHPLGLETGLTPEESSRLLDAERDALRAARGVIVTSASTVDPVMRLGCPADRIAVVEPGTDTRPIAVGSGSRRTNLLCVASLTPRKGHDTLLDGLERIATLDWHLTCVGRAFGDGTWAEQVRRQAQSGALAGRVTFAGELSGDSLDAAYDEADLFVLPTRYEGYGMVVAEALARGLPIVSTPTGGIADLIGDTAGFLVAPDDPAALAGCIRLFMTDRMVRARMRQGALLARSRLRDWEAAAAQFEEAIQRFTAA
jgi:glycosyltransferase involved in cell wall biosynthesis